MTETITQAEIVTNLHKNGRILFPAYIRKAFGLENGGEVIVQLKDGIITIKRKDTGEELFNGNQKQI